MSSETPNTATHPAQPLEHNLQDMWTRGALFVAVVGIVGSMYLSVEMNLKACPYCLYQRAFIMAAAGVLALGLFVHVPPAIQGVLALPAASAGASLAGYHTYLDFAGKLECPAGITGFLSAPLESFLIFAVLIGLLFGAALHRQKFLVHSVGAALLGVVFCISCVRGVHPDPISPTGPLDGCRKVVSDKK
ncbi:MAG: disulfide bond formation protein B [Planctomycetes bacterium]|nr:disulfide bond formation protein B [Planctomycetota bacterium]